MTRKEAEKLAKKERRRLRAAKGIQPARSEHYRRFINGQPCCICGRPAPSEAAHAGDNRGMAQKSSDFDCIPLCRTCHQEGRFSHHKLTADRGEAFFRHHGRSRDRLIAFYRETYCITYPERAAEVPPSPIALS